MFVNNIRNKHQVKRCSLAGLYIMRINILFAVFYFLKICILCCRCGNDKKTRDIFKRIKISEYNYHIRHVHELNICATLCQTRVHSDVTSMQDRMRTMQNCARDT